MRRSIFAVLPEYARFCFQRKRNFFADQALISTTCRFGNTAKLPEAGGAAHWTGKERGAAMARPAVFYGAPPRALVHKMLPRSPLT
jgi:hypothetical protein